MATIDVWIDDTTLYSTSLNRFDGAILDGTGAIVESLAPLKFKNSLHTNTRLGGKLSVEFNKKLPSLRSTNGFGFSVSVSQGLKVIAWSKIGEADFTIDRSNVAGNCYVPYKGEMFGALTLDKKVMVYSYNGITTLIPSGAGFEIKHLDLDCLSRDSYAGSSSQHFFVSKALDLYIVQDSAQKLLSLKKFGFTTVVKLRYLPITKELFISDASKTYVLKSIGDKVSLYKCADKLSDIQVFDSVTVAAGTKASDRSSTFWSSVIDFQMAADKTVQTLEIEADCLDGITAQIAMSDDNKTWHLSGWLPLEDTGLVYYTSTAKFFKFGFKVAVGYTPVIHGIYVNVQNSDKRTFIRSYGTGGVSDNTL